MNAKTLFTATVFGLISLFFIRCKSNTKTFQYNSVGWKVTVPADMQTGDSATIYKALTNISSQERRDIPGKLLLQVLEKDGLWLTGPSLVAGIKPMKQGKEWEDVLQVIRSQYTETYNRDYLPKTNVDSLRKARER
jgi:hypothetical protein